jgi:hypothetical protein
LPFFHIPQDWDKVVVVVVIVVVGEMANKKVIENIL